VPGIYLAVVEIILPTIKLPDVIIFPDVTLPSVVKLPALIIPLVLFIRSQLILPVDTTIPALIVPLHVKLVEFIDFVTTLFILVVLPTVKLLFIDTFPYVTDDIFYYN
jgi:hypothetical protein